MDSLMFVIIATSFGLQDATFCYFYKKEEEWPSVIWNLSTGTKGSMLYKISVKERYCSESEICCGSSCCPNPNFYNRDADNHYYDTDQKSGMSAGIKVGISVASIIAFAIFFTYCVTCLKRGAEVYKEGQQEEEEEEEEEQQQQQQQHHHQQQQQPRVPIYRDVQQYVVYSPVLQTMEQSS
ncbi:uncharacterized protein LOC111106650 isoform X2 [Crassostrea virginica]